MFGSLQKLLNQEVEICYDSFDNDYIHKQTIIGFSEDFRYVHFKAEGEVGNKLSEFDNVIHNVINPHEVRVGKTYILSVVFLNNLSSELMKIQKMFIARNKILLESEIKKLKNKIDAVEANIFLYEEKSKCLGIFN